MEKIIEINGKELKLKTSAAVPRLYRLIYERDIFDDFNYLNDQIQAGERPPEMYTILENVLHLMNRYADDTQPDSVEEWLDQFETLDIVQVLPVVVEMWKIENTSTSKAKKNTEKQQDK